MPAVGSLHLLQLETQVIQVFPCEGFTSDEAGFSILYPLHRSTPFMVEESRIDNSHHIWSGWIYLQSIYPVPITVFHTRDTCTTAVFRVCFPLGLSCQTVSVPNIGWIAPEADRTYVYQKSFPLLFSDPFVQPTKALLNNEGSCFTRH
jgi:hypothetical protein